MNTFIVIYRLIFYISLTVAPKLEKSVLLVIIIAKGMQYVLNENSSG